MNHLCKALICLALPLVLSGCFKTRAEIEREKQQQEVQQSLHKNVYETTETLQQTQAQVARLQGRMEELEHNRRKDDDEKRKALAGITEKLTLIEQRLSKSDETEAALIEEIKKIKEDNIRMLSQPAAQGAKKKGSPDKGAYQLAMEAFKAKRYEEAADQFTKYAEANGKAANALKARYYAGASHFALKNWAEAIMSYSFVYDKNPQDPLWKKSTLKIAESFQRMGKKKDARPFALSLVEKHPDSTEAKQAKKFLN